MIDLFAALLKDIVVQDSSDEVQDTSSSKPTSHDELFPTATVPQRARNPWFVPWLKIIVRPETLTLPTTMEIWKVLGPVSTECCSCIASTPGHFGGPINIV